MEQPEPRHVGTLYEKATVKWHERRGIPCRLTHASGQLRRKWSDWRADLDIGREGRQWRFKGEVKWRADAQGWKRLDEWIASYDVLVLASGHVLMSMHGYEQAWEGIPSPITSRQSSCPKTAAAYLSHADMAFLWRPPDYFSVLATWETLVRIFLSRGTT